jgi:ParB/RepB/Spo0J family partition protein
MNETIASLGTASEIQFQEVPTESILANPRGNPRKNIKQRDIDKLCESIIACGGILVPLVVFQGPREGTYYLLDGERRLIAARKLGLKKVPVNILPRVLPDDKNLETMFTIHMARVPWNTMARAMALNEYLALKPAIEKDRKLLRQITGMSPYEINNALLVRMFPKEVQLKAVYPEKPGGLEPSYLIELAKFVNKAEDLGLSDENLRPKVIDSFLKKIERKIIRDPYQLKDLQNILGNTSKKEAQNAFHKLVDDPTYGIDSLILSYAGKIKGLRSFHAHATERSIGDALTQTKTQWNALLMSLMALKGIKLPEEDLKEIKKLMRQTRSAVKSIL